MAVFPMRVRCSRRGIDRDDPSEFWTAFQGQRPGCVETATAGKTDPDDIPETPKKPITRTGDLWVLGKHRIVCGDSTDQKTVERLLDGAEPDLMVTDPPYGVNYDASWRYKAGVNTKEGAFGKSVNDDTNDWQVAYALFPGRIAYVWMSSLALPSAARGLDACGFIRRSLII